MDISLSCHGIIISHMVKRTGISTIINVFYTKA